MRTVRMLASEILPLEAHKRRTALSKVKKVGKEITRVHDRTSSVTLGTLYPRWRDLSRGFMNFLRFSWENEKSKRSVHRHTLMHRRSSPSVICKEQGQVLLRVQDTPPVGERGHSVRRGDSNTAWLNLLSCLRGKITRQRGPRGCGTSSWDERGHPAREG